MSLRGLINSRIIFSVIIIILVGGLLTIWQARHSVEREVNSSFNLALQMIDLGFSHLSRTSMTEYEWLQQISAIQHTRHLHISLINEENEEVEWFVSDDIDEELPPQWFQRAVKTTYPSSKYDIKLADGRVKKIIVRADPMDEIAEAWEESEAYFWSVMTMVAVIFLAINFVFNSMLQNVRTIVVGLRRVESGQYGRKLPPFKISEFDAIATEINHLSDALKVAKENNQALARHTMQIQESERRNLSRELHDEMGQSLTAIKAMSTAIRQPGTDVAKISDSIAEICNHLAGVVRSMMRTLHPLSLADLGLGATLTDLVNEWRRRHPDLVIKLDYDDRLDDVSHELAIHVYRIAQECLTNVVRHANATEVTLLIRQEGEHTSPRVVMRIHDNGQGGETSGHGFGVLAMRERVENMGGRFRFESEAGKGVNVSVWMPIIEKTENE
ncbi:MULTISPECIES: histidine kinase [unclassified Methylophaga]|jgi:two-component system sensor histidine kinase UhpB|uniref:histidine kinase n=1 Tax=unclassified Methylophaga TaxID=2629249 RepID=UPI000C95B426|nr:MULTISPECIES: histidine kinase [unclassified Methylophaga]MAP27879.1 sensor histidine kinase [Methylophaga sp.]|tara:strand:- start:24367 stop:25695 length:1329 start_codon:yes stop_codon:yes gene_type:complete